MAEFIIILSMDATSDQVTAVVDAVQSNGGQVLQAYSPTVIIADGEQSVQDAVDALQGQGVVLTSTTSVDNLDILNLDETTSLIVQAWNYGLSDEYLTLVANNPATGEPFDFHGSCILTEDNPLDAGGEGNPIGIPMEAPVPKAPVNPWKALAGSVAVGIVIVDGPAGSSVEFTVEEKRNTILGMSKAFDLLCSFAPANVHLVFLYDLPPCKIDVDPASIPPPPPELLGKITTDTAKIEPRWRDPALQQLHCPPSTAGIQAYTQSLMTRNWPFGTNPSAALAIFITKYNTAGRGWSYMPNCMGITIPYTYEVTRPDIGVEKFDIVFAHEIAHLFGALDEYGACSIKAVSGINNVANGNCACLIPFGDEACFQTNPFSVDCFMKVYSRTICSSTEGQLGWS